MAGNCRRGELSLWETVAMRICWMGNRLLGKCRGGKLLWWEIISLEIVGWETVGWEFVEWETVEWKIVISKNWEWETVVWETKSQTLLRMPAWPSQWKHVNFYLFINFFLNSCLFCMKSLVALKTHSFQTSHNCVNKAIILCILVCFATSEEEN